MAVAHWRHTMKPARFAIMDARASFALLLFLLHMSLYTLAFLVMAIAVFWVFERRGYGFDAALRVIRLHLAGPERPPVNPAKMRLPVDYDRRPLF